MSFSGIDKVKSSATTIVGVQKRGMVNLATNNSTHLNVDFMPNGSYTGGDNRNYHIATKTINVENALSDPSSGYVNLGFDFVYVGSSLQRQTVNSIVSDIDFLSVDNFLTYSYTKNSNVSHKLYAKVLNVISSNSEYEITLNLDGTSLPVIDVFYPNVDERADVNLDEDIVWS